MTEGILSFCFVGILILTYKTKAIILPKLVSAYDVILVPTEGNDSRKRIGTV